MFNLITIVITLKPRDPHHDSLLSNQADGI